MKVYNKTISEKAVQDICSLVKDKPTYTFFDDDYIKRELRKILEQNTSYIDGVNDSKKQVVKDIVKRIRARYHDVYELFQLPSISQRTSLLESIDSDHPFSLEAQQVWEQLLHLHRSTQERFSTYTAFYTQLLEICGMPDSIIDISAGHNPCSLYLLNEITPLPNSFQYDTTTFTAPDSAFLEQVLEKYGVSHKCHAIDIAQHPEDLKNCRPAQLALLLKVLDVTETQNRNSTYDILSNIPAPVIIASFPTKNIRNQSLTLQERPWMKRMCTNLGYTFRTFSLPNELFYVIEK